MEPFGDLVRRIRTEAEISLRTVAKELGWTPAYVSDIERGKRPAPNAEAARKWAAILKADPDLLEEAALWDRGVVKFPVDPDTDKGQALAMLARSWADLTPEQEDALMKNVQALLGVPE